MTLYPCAVRPNNTACVHGEWSMPTTTTFLCPGNFSFILLTQVDVLTNVIRAQRSRASRCTAISTQVNINGIIGSGRTITKIAPKATKVSYDISYYSYREKSPILFLSGYVRKHDFRPKGQLSCPRYVFLMVHWTLSDGRFDELRFGELGI